MSKGKSVFDRFKSNPKSIYDPASHPIFRGVRVICMKYYSMSYAAKRLDISVPALWKRVQRNSIGNVLINGRPFIPEKALREAEWLQAGITEVTSVKIVGGVGYAFHNETIGRMINTCIASAKPGTKIELEVEKIDLKKRKRDKKKERDNGKHLEIIDTKNYFITINYYDKPIIYTAMPGVTFYARLQMWPGVWDDIPENEHSKPILHRASIPIDRNYLESIKNILIESPDKIIPQLTHLKPDCMGEWKPLPTEVII